MRSVLLFIILFAIISKLYGEDLEFITVKRTMLYDNTTVSFNPMRDTLFEIDEGTIVKYVERPYILVTQQKPSMIRGTFKYLSENYLINCADLIPLNTNNTFDSTLITDLNGIERKTWVPWYFPNVLQSMDRNVVLLYDTFWANYDPLLHAIHGDIRQWYDIFFGAFPLNTLSISNSALVYNRLIGFIIRNIQTNNLGYVVTVKFNDNNWKNYKEDDLNWDIVNNKEFFDMILILDGDYMDVFLENMDNKLTTFVLVEQALLDELYSLGINKPVDLSRITHWPRRADGSMDYPPPSVNTSNDQNSLEESEQVVDSKTTLESESPQTTKDSQFPLWLFIGGGLVLLVVVGVGVVIVVKHWKKG